MCIVDHDGSVLIETNVGSVTAPVLLASADDNGLYDFALLHGAVGRSFFNRSGNNVAEAGLQSQSAAERQNDLELAGAGVIGHREHGSHLHSHGFFSFRTGLMNS